MSTKSSATVNAVESILQEMIEEESGGEPVNLGEYCRRYPDLAPFIANRYQLACLRGELPKTLEHDNQTVGMDQIDNIRLSIARRIKSNPANEESRKPTAAPPHKAISKHFHLQNSFPSESQQPQDLIQQLLIKFCHRHLALRGAVAVRSYLAENTSTTAHHVQLTAQGHQLLPVALAMDFCREQNRNHMEIGFSWPESILNDCRGEDLTVVIICGNYRQSLGQLKVAQQHQTVNWKFED